MRLPEYALDTEHILERDPDTNPDVEFTPRGYRLVYMASIQAMYEPEHQLGQYHEKLWETGYEKQEFIRLFDRTDRKCQLLDIPLAKKTLAKDKKTILRNTELLQAWEQFLKDHVEDMDKFFAENYTRCECSTPSIIHKEIFCPNCGEINPRYQGLIGVYEDFTVTAQDIIEFNLDVSKLELFDEISELHLKSITRMYHAIKDSLDPDAEYVKIRLDNTTE